MGYNHECIVLFFSFQLLFDATPTSCLPCLLVLPCFCVPSSPSAVPAADTGGSLYLLGSSCDGSMRGTLRKKKKNPTNYNHHRVRNASSPQCSRDSVERGFKPNNAALFAIINQFNQSAGFESTTNQNQVRGRAGCGGGYKRQSRQESEGRRTAGM